jgi:thiamine-monophosphate kinase
LLDGVHFRLDQDGAFAVGRKAMARNLSDIAAMAAKPLWAVGSLAMPRNFSHEDARQLHLGRRSVSDAFNCPVVGGDVGSWDGPLTVSLTIIGQASEKGPVLRSGARPGDALLVTGALGGAWRDDKHLNFTPRVAEALALAEAYPLSAMIDLSDGLSTDLMHLCQASGCGAVVQAAELPLRLRPGGPVDPLEAALNDGEDYELLFALEPRAAEKLLSAQPLEVPVSRIGSFTEKTEIVLVDTAGQAKPLAPGGWQHETREQP